VAEVEEVVVGPWRMVVSWKRKRERVKRDAVVGIEALIGTPHLFWRLGGSSTPAVTFSFYFSNV
jgi:uncharacterized membrane protein